MTIYRQLKTSTIFSILISRDICVDVNDKNNSLA